MDHFLELYLQLTGPFEKLNGMSAVEVQQVFVKALDRDDWPDLTAGFSAFVDDYLANGTVAQAGAGEPDEVIYEDDWVTVGDNGDWVSFVFTGKPEDTLCQGNLLFDRMDRLDEGLSSLYDAQYGNDVPYEGYRYGVRYDQNEIGLYDYATNQLLAKYIWGITPSDEYFDPERKTISVRFRKDVIDGRLPGADAVRLLPY
jgi:hypothetical protein